MWSFEISRERQLIEQRMAEGSVADEADDATPETTETALSVSASSVLE